MDKKSLLTKVKTKVSTRTALLVAVGLLIIGGAAFGLAPLLKTNTVFNISDSGIKIGSTALNMVVYAGQGGTGNLAVPTICKALKDKGIIRYDIDYNKSVAGSVASQTCSRRTWYGAVIGSTTYQAFDTVKKSFVIGSCSGNNTISYYTSVNCAVNPAIIKGDLNGDGKVDQADLYLLIDMADGTKPADLARGNIDGDGVITYNDVVWLAKSIPASLLRGDMNGDKLLTSMDVNILSEMYNAGIASNGVLTTQEEYNKITVLANKFNFSVGVGVNPKTGKGYDISGEDDLVVRGDMNANGKIDQNDIVLMKKLIGAIKGDMNASNTLDPYDLYILISMADGATKPVDIERGDINGDGGISRDDVLALKKLITGALLRGDMNRDGKLDNTDANILSEIYNSGRQPDQNMLLTLKNNASYNIGPMVASYNDLLQSGDMNANGSIDQGDVPLIKKLVSGDLINYNDATTSAPKGDLNADGKLDWKDLYLLLDMADGAKPVDLAKGDLNGDGVISLADLLALKKLVPQGAGFPRADLNGDGVIDGTDVNILSDMYNAGIASNGVLTTQEEYNKILPIGNKYNFSIGVGVNPQTGKGYNISGEDDLVVRGDLNANSKIDQGDVTLIKKLVSGL